MDGGHGRALARRCWTIEVGGHRLIDSDRWAEVGSVALIETERFEAEPDPGEKAENGPVSRETVTEKRYVISSLPPDAKQLLAATRRHWRIENQLRWSLDVAFGEDSRPGAQRRRGQQSRAGSPTSPLAAQTGRSHRRGNGDKTASSRTGHRVSRTPARSTVAQMRWPCKFHRLSDLCAPRGPAATNLSDQTQSHFIPKEH